MSSTKANAIQPVSEEEELRLKVTKSPYLTGTDPEAKRKEILQYFHDTFTLYEKLFEPMSEKSFFMRADPLRHHLIFYYGHTACFFVNKLTVAGAIDKRVNEKFESIFAIGVDEMSWDDLLPDNFDWPSVKEVKEYRDTVRDIVDEIIKTTPLTLPIKWDDTFWAVVMGIEHERIHLETSAVLIRQLPLTDLTPVKFWEPYRGPSSEPPKNELLPVLDGAESITLGKPYDHNLYGWDNEYGEHTEEVQSFKASKYLVTNREFMGFVEDGGYGKQELWTEEGWRFAQFVTKKKTPHPRFWVPVMDVDGTVKQWRHRLMLEVIDMPWDWPVEVNNLEAKAFCNWKSRKTGLKLRLPTEAEWNILRRHELGDDVDQTTWEKAPGNINLEYWASSQPVTYFAPSKNGFHDVIGNVWQHTETPFDPFKGFRVHKWYDDFSVPTFDLQHNVIKGGCWISTGNEAQRHSRYAFRRHFYQCAGFRYVEAETEVNIRNDVYERDESIALYCHFHYGTLEMPLFSVPPFCKSVPEFCLTQMEGRSTKRAMDIGCAVGRMTFELARGFDYMLGLDFSARFIRMAVALQEQGSFSYSIQDEGDLQSQYTVQAADHKIDEALMSKCEFYQSDACNLDPRYTNYDLILASNLLDRLYEPRLFLDIVSERVNRGGLFIIGSPYQWDETFTPRKHWLGGYTDKTGAPVRTLDELTRIMVAKGFRLKGSPTDIPLLMRESGRKCQHTLSQFTVWEKL